MNTFRKNLFCLLFIALFLTSSFAQSSSLKSENFSSIDGGYSIEIPVDQNKQIIQPLNPQNTSQLGTGKSITWTAKDIYFEVRYVDLDISKFNIAEDKKQDFLKLINDNVIQSIESKNNGKLKSEKPISIGNTTGRELVVETAKTNGISRSLILNNRLYRLTVFFISTQETLALKFLDSFKLQSREEIIAQKIITATPSSLPQETVTKKSKSDAEDDNLKGKIKSVLVEKESIKDGNPLEIRQKLSETQYDAKGKLVKTIFYDFNGIPNSITVFGYIDGMRVSKIGYVEVENVIRGITATLTAPKPRDTRYHTRYEYKYDAKKRFAERIQYGNDGEINSKAVFTYNGNQVEELRFDRSGKSTYKSTVTLDEKGDTIEESYTYLPSKPAENKYTYQYESYDSKGNWTKRTVSRMTTKDGQSIFEPSSINYRTITYYQ